MAVLKYITRGEQTAQGKQKAYFCAHSDDFEKYFDKISNEILDTLAKENNRNCAFFYLDDAAAERDEKFLFSLKEMNLVIMPVTKKLLTTANPALDVEFKFAIGNGIPVLPLMMEPGLEIVFNAKCGDLQFLDPNSRDDTAISYEEKLTKYLTSVLIDDELAKKIRKAFDAYIFLSYRKKDRQYAQELMRLIHKNEFCRDIAIWYDEFLTPGENFNKAIENALKKSKLFALAVTPSLLEKSKDKDGNECENYIVTTEYPMAKKAGKLILPAELVETDKKALAEKYDSLPVCVRSDDESALSASLKHALEGIALRKNDNDPEHNFFIGLAYLGGIDVEKHSERAIKLITSAAEAELPEAMEKLISIYTSGEAGEKDYEKSFEWGSKLVAKRKKIYDEKQDETSATDYLTDILYHGDRTYYLSQRKNDAEKVFTEMLVASEKISKKFKNNRILSILSLSYDRLGKLHLNKDEFIVSKKYYRKSLGIRKKLAFETGSADYLHALSVGYRNVGNIYLKSDQLNIAKIYYHKALNISKKLAIETGTAQDYIHLAMTYYTISYVSPKKRTEYLNQALDIWTRLTEQYPDVSNYASFRDTVKNDLGIE